MSEATPDRIDRIEAALDRQVAVNADLRTSVEQLRATTEELRATTEELRATTEALLQIATIHQQNFEQLSFELNTDRLEWRTQIERIWGYLSERGNG
jgi:methyl-accepting chemotaxis protein